MSQIWWRGLLAKKHPWKMTPMSPHVVVIILLHIRRVWPQSTAPSSPALAKRRIDLQGVWTGPKRTCITPFHDKNRVRSKKRDSAIGESYWELFKVTRRNYLREECYLTGFHLVIMSASTTVLHIVKDSSQYCMLSFSYQHWTLRHWRQRPMNILDSAWMKRPGGNEWKIHEKSRNKW